MVQIKMVSRSTRRNAKLLCWIVKIIVGFSINFAFSLYILNLTGVISNVILTLCLVPTMVTILLAFAVLVVLKDIDS